MEKLILASASPRRKELLGLLGLPFTVMVSDAKEETSAQDPADMVWELSLCKAEAVAPAVSQGIILGADTIVWAREQGEVLGKPRDREDAARMLRMLQGSSHEVYTGVTLLVKRPDAGTMRDTFVCQTIVHVHAMTDEEIEAYLDTGDPFDKAGSYGIQGPFAVYVDGIEGDYTNVVGLPVSALYRHLKALGYTR